ncbi:MAG: PmeII family type II restriction endonuclease [Planctomycetia bacterium]|nr:PmeII family type II restriction endonuclease [Planctomycetia bacterium]
MISLNLKDVVQYVEENIKEFHQSRLNKLEQLKLNEVLKKKNPYLFRTKNLLTPESIVRALTDAYISSAEETIFGNWLENLAIFVNEKVYQGKKSGIRGIDLEFDDNNTRFIVAIKSGPNWGNSSQIKKMEIDFSTAMKTLRTSNSRMNIIAINGCCYGKDDNPNKGQYFKYCGQRFWEFISGDADLYLNLIEPLGYKAYEKNREFEQSYSALITRFSREFQDHFCSNNGRIEWEKLIKFNSEKKSNPT